jgi:hypothetical protein
MLGTIATLVFAIAGCTAAAVIGSSLRSALPALRRLAAERRALAEDRVYLFTLIETPRHDGTPAPVTAAVVTAAPAMAARTPGAGVVRRRAPLPLAAGRLRAAA